MTDEEMREMRGLHTCIKDMSIKSCFACKKGFPYPDDVSEETLAKLKQQKKPIARVVKKDKPKHCSPTEHSDQPLRRGSSRVRCVKCGDIFPCFHNCNHIDCMIEKKLPLPEWVSLAEVQRPDLVSEAITSDGTNR